MAALKTYRYRVIPINPILADQGIATILGEKVYTSLSAYAAATRSIVPTNELEDSYNQIYMVDIFWRAEEAGAVVDEAIAVGVKFVWLQIAVCDEEAAQQAKDSCLLVAMNCCPYDKLFEGIFKDNGDVNELEGIYQVECQVVEPFEIDNLRRTILALAFLPPY